MARIIYNNDNIRSVIAEKRPEYEYLSGNVENQLSYITLLHKNCNSKVTVQIKGFLSEECKGKCKVCNPVKVKRIATRLTEDMVIQRFTSLFPNGEYSYVSGFINSHSKMEVLHKKCGTVFNVSSHMFFGSKQTRCPFCANFNRSDYQKINRVNDDYLDRLLKDNNLHEDYYWMEPYDGDNKKKLLIFHKSCGERSLARPNDVQQGYLPCQCEGSKYEVRFKKLLDKAGITYETEFKVGKSFRVDLLIHTADPNNKIFIEIDGEFHFENSITKERDKRKEKLIAKKFPDYEFFRVKYDDDFEEIVKALKELLVEIENGVNLEN